MNGGSSSSRRPLWFVFGLLAVLGWLWSGPDHARAESPLGDATTWFPRVPRVVEPMPLVAVGDDLVALHRVSGGRLVIHELASGRRLKVHPLPRLGQRLTWTSLHLAPPTDGEVERAVVVARSRAGASRLVLIHLRTGRVIGEWEVAVQVPAGEGGAESTIHWSPDGARFCAVGWPLESNAVPGELAVRWVDAAVGTIVARIDVPELLPVDDAALLADGYVLALGTERRLVLLGPGPIDARTLAVPPGSRLVGAVADGIVLWRRDRLLLVDPTNTATPGRAAVVGEITADGLAGPFAVHPRGRWGLARLGAGVGLVDFRGRRVTPLLEAKARWALGRDRLFVVAAGRPGLVDLFRAFAP